MSAAGTFAWSLRADARAPAGARAALADDRFARLDARVRETIALLVSELVTNSVRHAGLSADDEIDVTIAAGNPVRVEVRDPGPGYRIKTITLPADGIGGFGLVILDRLASRWGVQGARPACVWFELDLERGGASAVKAEGARPAGGRLML